MATLMDRRIQSALNVSRRSARAASGVRPSTGREASTRSGVTGLRSAREASDPVGDGATATPSVGLGWVGLGWVGLGWVGRLWQPLSAVVRRCPDKIFKLLRFNLLRM